MQVFAKIKQVKLSVKVKQISQIHIYDFYFELIGLN